MAKNCAVILAAGDGTRMKSNHPKVLSEVLFKPMLNWSIDAATSTDIDKICIVTGYKKEEIESTLSGDFTFVNQAERKGTGHAVKIASDFIHEFSDGHCLVLYGDNALIDSETLNNAYSFHIENNNDATLITADLPDPFGYGRIIKNDDGNVIKIIEEKDCSEENRKITEINSGSYWFKTSSLLFALQKLSPNNSQHEYYLTDTVEILHNNKLKVDTYITDNNYVVLGANDNIQLASLNEIARTNTLHKHMLNGVNIPIKDGIIIGPDAVLGADTVILPGTIIRGSVTIGNDCIIGPNSFIENSTIGNNVNLNNVQCYKSTVEDNVTVGPFTQIRPDCIIRKGAKIGDFVELKNSEIGIGTKVPHLTYVGDSDVGSNVNFGCGCVTVNYDGVNKNRCKVGNNAFIGCNTNLVAPVEVGDFAYTAAGSTITDNIPADALAIARQRQINKDGWVTKKRPKK